MRHSWTFSILVAVAAIGLYADAAAGGQSRKVVFVVDCSVEMAGTLGASDQPAEAAAPTTLTRMDAARDALKTTLTRLAENGGYQAGVWLYGHRLGWGEGASPEMLEQDTYLGQTLGYQALSALLPGDDAELARPLTQLQSETLPATFMRLDAVKAWGEAPVYLALSRALENLGREASSNDTSLIVITSGVNRQGLCRFQTSKQQLLEAATKRGIPIHFVSLGGVDEPNRQGEVEFEQVATATYGTFARATSLAELAERIDEAVKARRTLPVTVATAPATTSGGGDAIKTVADVPPAPTARTVEGQVLVFNKPARGIRVSLSGSGLPATTTDAAGRFTFVDVAVGSYQLVYDGVVKNITRSGSKPLRIEGKTEPLALRLVLQ